MKPPGDFLCQKKRGADGKTFGFDEKELARKKAKYLDTTQYYAQYYNNPNAEENATIKSEYFQYYNRESLIERSGAWYLGDKLLNVYAAIDFAFSVSKRADYTVVVVVGADGEGNIYVLDIDRFRTGTMREMYERAVNLYRKWGYKRLRAEVTAAQQLVVNQLKDYIRTQNLPIGIDEHRPTRNKEERIQAALQPRYENRQIWHYKGGNCSILEEEVRAANAEHDDVKDALAAVVEIAFGPARQRKSKSSDNVIYHSRFGGVSFRG